MTRTSVRCLATGVLLVFVSACGAPGNSGADLDREIGRTRARLDAVRSELDAVSSPSAYLIVDRLEETIELKMKGTILFFSPVRLMHPDRTRRVCADSTLVSVPVPEDPPPGRYRIGVGCADGAEYTLEISTKARSWLGWVSGPEGGTVEVPAPEALRLYSNLREGMRIIFVEDAAG